MSIKIVVQGASHIPKVFCDHCNTEIITAEDGTYDWADEDLPTNVYFTHRRCSDLLRKQHPEINMNAELAVLMGRLSANLAVDETTAREVDEMENLI